MVRQICGEWFRNDFLGDRGMKFYYMNNETKLVCKCNVVFKTVSTKDHFFGRGIFAICKLPFHF